MKKIICSTLRVKNKGKNNIKLCKRVHGADFRRYMMLQVNGALYHSLYFYRSWKQFLNEG